MLRPRCAASPDFAARRLGDRPGLPLRDVLAEAPVVCFDRRDDLQDGFVRGLRRGRGGASSMRHLVPTSEGFVEAVAAGMGWGMVPLVQAAPLLDAGRLVNLVPDRKIDIPLFWQQWKLDFPALATVAEIVAAAATEVLDTT